MIKTNILLICLGLLCIEAYTQTEKPSDGTNQKFTKEFYFNQEPPGVIPELFAPGLICFPNRNEVFASYSATGNDFYFQVNDSIFYMDYKNNKWNQPKFASFLGDSGIGKYIRITADGKTFIFNRGGDIYANKLKGGIWSEPVKLSGNINSQGYECVASIAADQSVYFASHREGTKGQCDIFYSAYKNGEYQPPVAIDIFNSPRSECNILTSPENDFLIFTCYGKEDGFGSTDMYVSFQVSEGNWSEPKNMGETFNTKYADSPFSFTPDGKYFLFGRNNVIDSLDNMDIFWVDTKIFENYKE